jgi:hypothetical protein
MIRHQAAMRAVSLWGVPASDCPAGPEVPLVDPQFNLPYNLMLLHSSFLTVWEWHPHSRRYTA